MSKNRRVSSGRPPLSSRPKQIKRSSRILMVVKPASQLSLFLCRIVGLTSFKKVNIFFENKKWVGNIFHRKNFFLVRKPTMFVSIVMPRAMHWIHSCRRDYAGFSCCSLNSRLSPFEHGRFIIVTTMPHSQSVYRFVFFVRSYDPCIIWIRITQCSSKWLKSIMLGEITWIALLPLPLHGNAGSGYGSQLGTFGYLYLFCTTYWFS